MSPTGRALAFMSASLLALDGLVCLVLLSRGLEPVLVLTGGMVAGAAYAYVIYKRYRVEVITASDLKLFDDIDDLRLLCRIYGLDATGSAGRLRGRLEAFAFANKDRVFVWVAPMAISWAIAMDSSRLASADLAENLISDRTWGQKPETRPIILARSQGASRPRLKICPICDARAPLLGSTCKECGADLSLYLALSKSKIGRRFVGAKATAVRHKLRYEGATIGVKR